MDGKKKREIHVISDSMYMVLRRISSWFGIFLFLGMLFFYPLGRVFLLTFDATVFSRSSNQIVLDTLGFTLLQASLSTLITLFVGLPLAYLFSRYKFIGKDILRMLTSIPFMLPTVVVAAAFNSWLGVRGWMNLALESILNLNSPPIQFIGTLGAILLAHVFYNTTILIRIVGSALSSLDPRLDQAACSLGASPWKQFWNITLPAIRPALLASAMLIFLFDFTSFGVVLLLGGPRYTTLEVEIFQQTLTFFNLPLAAWLSIIQLCFTIIFAIVYTRLNQHATVSINPRKYPERIPTKMRERAFTFVSCIFLLVFYALPLLSLAGRSVTRVEADQGDRSEVRIGITLDYYRELFINRRNSVFYVPPAFAFINSMAYATFTVLLSLFLGLPAASALAHPSRLERVFSSILLLPLGTSAVTLGLGLIVAYGRLLVQPWFVPLVHTLIALPFVIRTLQPALASIPDRLRHAAISLGASPFDVWRNVDWPVIKRAVLSAAIFAFTISLGEFGATNLLYRPEYPTLPVAIYRYLAQPGGLNYGQAMAMATVLMLTAGVGIVIIERLRLPGQTGF